MEGRTSDLTHLQKDFASGMLERNINVAVFQGAKIEN
jgi:hypothetical protein